MFAWVTNGCLYCKLLHTHTSIASLCAPDTNGEPDGVCYTCFLVTVTVIYTPCQSGSGPPCRMLQYITAGGWVEIREQAQDKKNPKTLQLDYHLCAYG